MRFLIVGCGSIGKRHIGNLLSLGECCVIACDTSESRRAEIQAKFRIPVFSSLDEALSWGKTDVALICTPTAMHIEPALSCARAGCHLFIEKPISNTLDDVDELLSVVEEGNLVAMVGCDMRFLPCVQTIREAISSGDVGRILFVQTQYGNYLPGWHPCEDYRQSYSAKVSMGGGILLDAIQLVDYTTWLLGPVRKVFCSARRSGILDIETEDVADILLWLDGGVVANVHVDYLQRPRSHFICVVGDEFTLSWDVCHEGAGVFKSIAAQSYIDELEHFVRCVRGESTLVNSLGDAIRTLRVVLAAKESSATGKVVEL